MKVKIIKLFAKYIDNYEESMNIFITEGYTDWEEIEEEKLCTLQEAITYLERKEDVKYIIVTEGPSVKFTLDNLTKRLKEYEEKEIKRKLKSEKEKELREAKKQERIIKKAKKYLESLPKEEIKKLIK